MRQANDLGDVATPDVERGVVRLRASCVVAAVAARFAGARGGASWTRLDFRCCRSR